MSNTRSAASKKTTTVRMGPITLLVFVITLCLAVMATLSVSTARANAASTTRQAAFTADMYANETAAQTFVAAIDGALANGTDGVSAALPTLAQHATAQLDGGTCTAELQGNTLTATFERASGRQLMIELTLTDTSYKITKWKTATDWKEDKSETLWQG